MIDAPSPHGRNKRLDESSVDPDPIKQFRQWFRLAERMDPVHASAMVLATATSKGVPSARVVLLKQFDNTGFVFFTNYRSRKGVELKRNPAAALVFYWSLLDRQVRIEGIVVKASEEESESYFRTRDRNSQLAALASDQSAVLACREALDERFRKLKRLYGAKSIPRPAHWGGFRLKPSRMEFWRGRAGRMHDRILYVRRKDSSWTIHRLFP